MNADNSNTPSLTAGRPRRAAAAVVFAALFLLAPHGAAAQTQLTEEAAKQLRAQAVECSRAFVEGNYERLAGLTHPKVVEMMGGREKMAESVRKDMAEMKAEGFRMLSYAPGEPTQVLREGSRIYALLPTTLRTRTPSGVMVTHSFMVAFSADDGKNWRFLGGASLDGPQLKLLIPEVADELKLPAERHYPETEKKP
jgi:hypothetical protein